MHGHHTAIQASSDAPNVRYCSDCPDGLVTRGKEPVSRIQLWHCPRVLAFRAWYGVLTRDINSLILAPTRVEHFDVDWELNMIGLELSTGSLPPDRRGNVNSTKSVGWDLNLMNLPASGAVIGRRP